MELHFCLVPRPTLDLERCPALQILETPSLLASSGSTFGLKTKQAAAASSCCG